MAILVVVDVKFAELKPIGLTKVEDISAIVAIKNITNK